MNSNTPFHLSLLQSFLMSSPCMKPQVYQQTISNKCDNSPPRRPTSPRKQSQQEQIASSTGQQQIQEFQVQDSPPQLCVQQISAIETQQSIRLNSQIRSQKLSIIGQKEITEQLCSIFINNNKQFFIQRFQPCCCCNCNLSSCLQYKVQFTSPQFETATVKLRPDNCFSITLRSMLKLCMPMQALPEAESSQLDALKIEVYDGKGSVFLHNNLIGTFKRISPSLLSRVFCNELIELQVIPQYGKTNYTIKRQADCFTGCFESFISNNIPCCANEMEITILRDDNIFMTNSYMQRSDIFHFLSCIGLNCYKGQWNEAQINLENPALNPIHKCLLLGSWLYFIEFCQ